MKKSIILTVIIFILSIGYAFNDETICIGIYDAYYVASYFTIALYITYSIILFYLIKFIVSKIKKK